MNSEDPLITTAVDELLQPLREAAQIMGMTELARRSGVGREHLYKILNTSGQHTNPCLDTFINIAMALGYYVRLVSKG